MQVATHVMLSRSTQPGVHASNYYATTLLKLCCCSTQATCERALQKVLALEASLEVAQRYLASNPGAMVRAVLTEQSLRRLQKLPDEDDLDSEEF